MLPAGIMEPRISLPRSRYVKVGPNQVLIVSGRKATVAEVREKLRRERETALTREFQEVLILTML